MIGKLRFVALALVAAAFAAPLAQAAQNSTVPADSGFAKSYLQRLGMTPEQAAAWTTGLCSNAVKPASCELTPAQARAASVGLARALLGNRGLTVSQINDWTTGVCSYRDKPASCYLSGTAAAAASQHLAQSLGVPGSAPVATVGTGPSGFHWNDALIGAAVTAGILLLGAASALALRHRREPARA
jgi:hypothetical protein